MTYFLDTNVFVASLTDERGRNEVATDLLNSDLDLRTALLNLMELRTVLTKKKGTEQDEVRSTIQDIEDQVELVFHDTSDVLEANRMQQETLLYPMDCLILTLARDQQAQLVTFDTELIEAGAMDPASVLDDRD